MTSSRIVTALLLLCAANLTLMIPGGIVETREFPNYSIAVLAAFNIFLTGLGLGSFVLAYRVFRTGQVDLLVPIVGAAYIAVYLLDLGEVFPTSSAPMSPALFSMEWLGTVLGIALLALSLRSTQVDQMVGAKPPGLSAWMLIALGIMAVGIVLFATMTAIG